MERSFYQHHPGFASNNLPIAIAIFGCPRCRCALEKRANAFGPMYLQCTGCVWSCPYEARLQAVVQQLAELTCCEVAP